MRFGSQALKETVQRCHLCYTVSMHYGLQVRYRLDDLTIMRQIFSIQCGFPWYELHFVAV